MAAEKTPVAIIGGIALNANGVARFTGDIDATTPGADLDLEALVRTLKAHAIVPRMPKAIQFARGSTCRACAGCCDGSRSTSTARIA